MTADATRDALADVLAETRDLMAPAHNSRDFESGPQRAPRSVSPSADRDAAQRTEPSFRAPGFPVEESVVKAWSAALAALEKDANAPLPSM